MVVIDLSFIKASIEGASFGDAPTPVAQGDGKANANPLPARQNQIEEAEKEKKMRQMIDQQIKQSLPDGGWFQSMFGRGAGDLVKDLRMARRENKDMREAIDHAIDAIRIAKKQEVEVTLQSIDWIGKHEPNVRNLGIS